MLWVGQCEATEILGSRKDPFLCCLFKNVKHPTSWTPPGQQQDTDLRALQLQAWICLLFSNNFMCMSLVVFALVLSDQEVNVIQQTAWGRSHVSFCGCAVYFKQLDIRQDGQFASSFAQHSLLLSEDCYWLFQEAIPVAHLQCGSPASRVHKHSKPWGWVPSRRIISQWTKENIFTRKNFKRTLLISWPICFGLHTEETPRKSWIN